MPGPGVLTTLPGPPCLRPLVRFRLLPLRSWESSPWPTSQRPSTLGRSGVEAATNVGRGRSDVHMADWQTILGRAVRERRQDLDLTLDQASRAIGISRSHLN